MRKLRSTASKSVSTIGLFHCCLLALCVSIVNLTVTGCAGKASKPNQTLLNRPNTFVEKYLDDLDNHPIDPQIASISISRPVRVAEYSAYGWVGNATMWVSTADVIKPANADLLADYGMPTGQWRKMEFESDYVCFSEPLNIKGNVIRYRARGGRGGGEAYEHQLTLTINNHDTLQEAKRVFIEKVEGLYQPMEPVIRHRILNEQFVYPSGDKLVRGRFRAAEQWQPAPDPGFRYHSFQNQHWEVPFDHGGGRHDKLSVWREPLSENGYKWGDPFVIRVIYKPHIFP